MLTIMILTCIFAYLIGAIPFGLVLTKIFISQDIREIGSGNIGATNARRAGGWKLGLATLAGDILKGSLPVLFLSVITPENSSDAKALWMAMTALAAFFGHLFPVYLGFKTGGKGVATAAGGFGIILPAAVLISMGSFLLAVGLSKRISVGSLTAAAVLPVSTVFLSPSPAITGCAIVMALAITARHKDNIKRLIDGTEPSIHDFHSDTKSFKR